MKIEMVEAGTSDDTFASDSFQMSPSASVSLSYRHQKGNILHTKEAKGTAKTLSLSCAADAGDGAVSRVPQYNMHHMHHMHQMHQMSSVHCSFGQPSAFFDSCWIQRR
mmetsp:Transcript_228/g.532  ORF Transcript_228/g.532 Transcript_228/m.532 type:complete len:108 (-) Transcript_228:173-496(-)